MRAAWRRRPPASSCSNARPRSAASSLRECRASLPGRCAESSRPLSSAWFLMSSGVSPCAICHRISPRVMSMALMRPYGGFNIGSPWTLNASFGGPRDGSSGVSCRRSAGRQLAAAAACGRARAARRARPRDGVALDVRHLGLGRGYGCTTALLTTVEPDATRGCWSRDRTSRLANSCRRPGSAPSTCRAGR